MIKGFKEFVLRGNVIDLAVAVVIGAAFTAVVNAIVKGLINPLIGLLFSTKDLDTFVVGPFAIGSIIGAIISFLAVAAVVYVVFVLPMNKVKARAAARRGAGAEAAEALPSEQELLTEIRDLLAKQSA